MHVQRVVTPTPTARAKHAHVVGVVRGKHVPRDQVVGVTAAVVVRCQASTARTIELQPPVQTAGTLQVHRQTVTRLAREAPPVLLVARVVGADADAADEAGPGRVLRHAQSGGSVSCHVGLGLEDGARVVGQVDGKDPLHGVAAGPVAVAVERVAGGVGQDGGRPKAVGAVDQRAVLHVQFHRVTEAVDGRVHERVHHVVPTGFEGPVGPGGPQLERTRRRDR